MSLCDIAGSFSMPQRYTPKVCRAPADELTHDSSRLNKLASTLSISNMVVMIISTRCRRRIEAPPTFTRYPRYFLSPSIPRSRHCAYAMPAHRRPAHATADDVADNFKLREIFDGFTILMPALLIVSAPKLIPCTFGFRTNRPTIQGQADGDEPLALSAIAAEL